MASAVRQLHDEHADEGERDDDPRQEPVEQSRARVGPALREVGVTPENGVTDRRGDRDTDDLRRVLLGDLPLRVGHDAVQSVAGVHRRMCVMSVTSLSGCMDAG